jgi:cytochrome P450 family 20 subfamily A
MILSIALVAIVFLLNLVWLKWRRAPKNKGKIPGLTASDPELGNLGDIGRAGSLHQFLMELHGKFGPVTWFYWGKTPVVSVASPLAFQQTRRLFDRPVSLYASFQPLIGANSIQYANGDIGRYRRKHHYDAALSPISMRNHFFDVFQQVLREKIQWWQSEKRRESVPLHETMTSMAVQSITQAAFGSSLSSNDVKRIDESYHICWHEMEMRLQGQPVDSKRDAAFNQARSYLFEKVKEIVAQRRQHLGTDRKCFIDYLLEDDQNVLSEEHICDDVITMFVGGFHTTGNLLTWALYYLAKHPATQDRLFDELTQTYESEFPSIEELDQMSYLTNVINESLRVSVLAPWVSRVSTDDPLTVCGFHIPAGTPIIQALGVVMQNEKFWPNPKEFDPDRFAQDNKKPLPALAFSPFGFAGKRICPGYRFAHYEIGLFLAGIVRAFKVTLVDATSPVVPLHGLVTAPKDEIFVRLELR